MKAKVLKKRETTTAKIIKGCAGQKTSKKWCAAQDEKCPAKRMCEEKNYCPAVS